MATFVALQSGQHVIHVNLDQVTHVLPGSQGGAVLYFGNGRSVAVDPSPDQIAKMASDFRRQ